MFYNGERFHKSLEYEMPYFIYRNVFKEQ